MGMPKDADARKYYRAAIQRIEDAQQILERLERPAASIYIGGYGVECIFKALVLELTPRRKRKMVIERMKSEFGHNLLRLRKALEQRINVPKIVVDDTLLVSTWSPELRYEPGPGDPEDAQAFIAAARRLVAWANKRM
jgi:hypothetical protein